MTSQFIYDEQQTFYMLRGEFIMTDNPDIKRKTIRLDRKLAIELELYAVKKQVSGNALINRYIEEGLRRDKGQTTLDIEK